MLVGVTPKFHEEQSPHKLLVEKELERNSVKGEGTGNSYKTENPPQQLKKKNA